MVSISYEGTVRLIGGSANGSLSPFVRVNPMGFC